MNDIRIGDEGHGSISCYDLAPEGTDDVISCVSPSQGVASECPKLHLRVPEATPATRVSPSIKPAQHINNLVTLSARKNVILGWLYKSDKKRSAAWAEIMVWASTK